MSKMIQKTGDGSRVEAVLEGKERIYSQIDTRNIVRMTQNAASKEDLIELGRYVLEATKKQDSSSPDVKFE